jgi:hypothetical protein
MSSDQRRKLMARIAARAGRPPRKPKPPVAEQALPPETRGPEPPVRIRLSRDDVWKNPRK